MINNTTEIKKLDDEGNEIEATEDEKKQALAGLRAAIRNGTIEIAPEARASIEANGMSIGELLAALLGEDTN